MSTAAARREPTLEPRAAWGSKTKSHRRIIFVVDDEPMLRRALVRVLRRGSSYEVHVFENPIAALARMDELRPELVISDNEMPKMRGFDFLRIVRNERPGIRTLMLTGGVIGELIRASVAAGEIDCLMEKPWLDEQLRDTVRQLLGSK